MYLTRKQPSNLILNSLEALINASFDIFFLQISLMTYIMGFPPVPFRFLVWPKTDFSFYSYYPIHVYFMVKVYALG